MAPIAIVPLRNPTEGKSRLAGVLPPEVRRALVAAMFHDVVAALYGSGVDDVVVAAQGEQAARLARRMGICAVTDPDATGGLGDAVAAATDRFAGEDVVVVAADLPRLRSQDVDLLLGQHAQVVVAGTRRGGTGGLLRRPGGCHVARYGPDSARENLEIAAGAGMTTAAIEVPGFHDDVDVADDLAALTDGHVGDATSDVLRGVSLRRR